MWWKLLVVGLVMLVRARWKPHLARISGTTVDGMPVLIPPEPWWHILSRLGPGDDRGIVHERGLALRSPVPWRMMTEKPWMTWMRTVGLTREIQTGDAAFDREVFLLADNAGFAAWVRRDAEFRLIARRLFRLGADRIESDGANLWVHLNHHPSRWGEVDRLLADLQARALTYASRASGVRRSLADSVLAAMPAVWWGLATFNVLHFFTAEYRRTWHVNPEQVFTWGMTWGWIAALGLLAGMVLALRRTSAGPWFLRWAMFLVPLLVPYAVSTVLAECNIAFDREAGTSVEHPILARNEAQIGEQRPGERSRGWIAVPTLVLQRDDGQGYISRPRPYRVLAQGRLSEQEIAAMLPMRLPVRADVLQAAEHAVAVEFTVHPGRFGYAWYGKPTLVSAEGSSDMSELVVQAPVSPRVLPPMQPMQTLWVRLSSTRYTFPIFSLLAAVGVAFWFLNRRYAPPKPANESVGGLPLFEGQVVIPSRGLVCDSPIHFSVVSERFWYRVLRVLGLCKPLVTGDRGFDDGVVVICDDARFTEFLRERPGVRALLRSLLTRGVHTIECENGMLWLRSMDPPEGWEALEEPLLALHRHVDPWMRELRTQGVATPHRWPERLEALLFAGLAYALVHLLGSFVTGGSIENPALLFSHALLLGAISSVVGLVAVLLRLRHTTRGPRLILEGLLVAPLVVPFALSTLLADINVAFDFAEPDQATVMVEAKRYFAVRYGSGRNSFVIYVPHLLVDESQHPWIPPRFSVRQREYDAVEPGDYMRFTRHHGALGYAWRERFVPMVPIRGNTTAEGSSPATAESTP